MSDNVRRSGKRRRIKELKKSYENIRTERATIISGFKCGIYRPTVCDCGCLHHRSVRGNIMNISKETVGRCLYCQKPVTRRDVCTEHYSEIKVHTQCCRNINRTKGL